MFESTGDVTVHQRRRQGVCLFRGAGGGGGGGGGENPTHFSDRKLLCQNVYLNGGLLSSSPYVTELTSKKRKENLKGQNHRGAIAPPRHPP